MGDGGRGGGLPSTEAKAKKGVWGKIVPWQYKRYGVHG